MDEEVDDWWMALGTRVDDSIDAASVGADLRVVEVDEEDADGGVLLSIDVSPHSSSRPEWRLRELCIWMFTSRKISTTSFVLSLSTMRIVLVILI